MINHEILEHGVMNPKKQQYYLKHESITVFQKKYSKHVADQILLSQKDIGNAGMLKLYPVYMLPFILEEL